MKLLHVKNRNIKTNQHHNQSTSPSNAHKKVPYNTAKITAEITWLCKGSSHSSKVILLFKIKYKSNNACILCITDYLQEHHMITKIPEWHNNKYINDLYFNFFTDQRKLSWRAETIEKNNVLFPVRLLFWQ